MSEVPCSGHFLRFFVIPTLEVRMEFMSRTPPVRYLMGMKDTYVGGEEPVKYRSLPLPSRARGDED
jgi:hypothetical protein